MRKIIALTAIALGLSGGVALADGRSSPTSNVRDHRGGVSVGLGTSFGTGSFGGNAHSFGGPNRSGTGYQGVAPVYANRGTFRFSGGFTRPLIRPRVNARYTSYNQRPAPVAQNYQSVAGYIWIAGQWQWNGYEWIWQDGHYEPDPAYSSSSAYPGYPAGY